MAFGHGRQVQSGVTHAPPEGGTPTQTIGAEDGSREASGDREPRMKHGSARTPGEGRLRTGFRRSFLVAVITLLALAILCWVVRDGVLGRTVCSGTWNDALNALVSKATFPEGGSAYCVHSNSHGTIAHVSIDEPAVLLWLKSQGACAHDLPYGYGVGAICDHDGWYVSDGWIARFQFETMLTTVVCDRQKHIAIIMSHTR